MTYSNFHTHCKFCDGEGEPEQFIKEAITRGFKSIGFSSHAPLPIDEYWVMKEEALEEYCHTIKLLKNKYKNIIDVNLGLEIDYNTEAIGDNFKRFNHLGLDYKIGAVHIIFDKKTGRRLCFDGSKEDFETIINEFLEGDVKKAVHSYYSLVREMIENIKPDIVAHFDLLKKQNKDNRYFNEEETWYKNEVLETLEVVKQRNSIIEVNTGGIARKFLSSMYPSDWILKECKKMDIPIVLSSDAHQPCNINFYFDEAARILKNIGYEKQLILSNGSWNFHDL
ncbi:MAG: histidinol-phosphatase HisJ [Deltaproteobacteria bacterium]